MARLTRDQMYLEICDVLAKRSTCARQNVGAVLVFNHRMVSHGTNGPPSGEPHCQGQDCPLTETGGCSRSVHAEENAINYAPKKLENLSLYVTLSPCEHCAKKIIAAGNIKKVFYRNEYRDKTGVTLLLSNRIDVYRLTTAGQLINVATNELVQ